MTREEILKDYTIDEHGIIRTPGKFEGEMLYAPYFYGQMLDGFGEQVYDTSQEGDDGDCDSTNYLYTEIEVGHEDRTEFPELDPSTTHVQVSESGAGFAYVEEV